MNITDVSGALRGLVFRLSRALWWRVPGGRIRAFGTGEKRISTIIVVNLDRQPKRWQRVRRELARYRTADGMPLLSITRRLAAVDARDGRAVAATADVDAVYRIGDQLHVQPDPKLAACFEAVEPVKMTRQEVAVARSHVEVWKAIVAGNDAYVLVLEDDIWFRRGSPRMIDRGWNTAVERARPEDRPELLYFSYADAGGTLERLEQGDGVFRPIRGLWFLSGYVLSREGAATLLRSMPVVGPVDLWMNFRFGALNALALTSPAILQRQDGGSDNVYSILPYLARAGIVDSGRTMAPPRQTRSTRVLAWTVGAQDESLAMALSMLGFRVRVFDGDEAKIQAKDLPDLLATFDALIDPPLAPSALSAVINETSTKFLKEAATGHMAGCLPALPSARTLIYPTAMPNSDRWRPLCAFLGLEEPALAFPRGATRNLRVFRDGRSVAGQDTMVRESRKDAHLIDDSPWVLPPRSDWRPSPPLLHAAKARERHGATKALSKDDASFRSIVETFPGSMASFETRGVQHFDDGMRLIVRKAGDTTRPYCSGAIASTRLFAHGRFEAQIKAACGKGLVTGFFLHRSEPRQEIDIEFIGGDPTSMLVNVYFNPGDDGTALDFGYRGTPYRVTLGFDVTTHFHHYAIDWQPDCITWSVDGIVVHRRVSWDPTPIPHLPMRLYSNLWVPRSKEFAGAIDDQALPAEAIIKGIAAWTFHRDGG